MKSIKRKTSQEIYEELSKEYTPEEIAEAYVFPSDSTTPWTEEMNKQFRDHMTGVWASYSPEQRLRFRLLELRIQIHSYLKEKDDKDLHFFGEFLERYISLLEKSNKEFADEISISQTELSLVINRRRNPSEKLIIRLDIHSNRNFPAQLWFKVLEKDRLKEILKGDIIKKEKKFVKRKLKIEL